jgi:hypothetical protein
MTNKIKLTLLMSAVLLAALLPAAAQSSTPPPQNNSTAAPPSTADPAMTVGQHKKAQQDRISKGVASGELNASEASKLENQQSKLNQETSDMRKANNGKLTAADRASLRQQQNQMSHEIHQDKHNAGVQNTNPKGEIGQRDEKQQGRIAQGVESGQLNAGEASHLENKEAAINHEAQADRKANGGKLTAQEKAQVNSQQNNVSKQIHNDKNNSRKKGD